MYIHIHVDQAYAFSFTIDETVLEIFKDGIRLGGSYFAQSKIHPLG